MDNPSHIPPFETDSERYQRDAARTKLENARNNSEAKFRTLLDVLPHIIWSNAADGTAEYFNHRWFEYTGLTLDESVGLGWQRVVHPDDAPTSVLRWQRALALGQIFDTEYRLRRSDGVYRWHICRNIPLQDRNGRVNGWLGTATDIQDLKMAEEALRESEERFRFLVEGTRDYAMFLTDPQRRIIHWNNGAERIFGYTRQEIIGTSADIIFTPEDIAGGEPAKEAMTALATGSANDKRWHLRADGSRFWADGVMTRLDDASGNLRGFAKIARDETRERQAEQALEQAHRDLQQAHEVLEQRVAERTRELAELNSERQELLQQILTTQEQERRRISRELHDQLGQQLTALTLRLNLLERELTDQPRLLQAVRSLADLLAQTSETVRSLALQLRPPALDLVGLSETLRNYVQDWGNRFNLNVHYQSLGMDSVRLPETVEIVIYRIVQEALTNVLRHARATQVSVLLDRRENQVVVIIEDNGIGFDVARAQELAVSQRSLGLLSMRERASLVRGTLEIESLPDVGTTVFVHIPFGESQGQ
jgi:PAS domain S-box-containing protein